MSGAGSNVEEVGGARKKYEERGRGVRKVCLKLEGREKSEFSIGRV